MSSLPLATTRPEGLPALPRPEIRSRIRLTTVKPVLLAGCDRVSQAVGQSSGKIVGLASREPLR